MRKIPGPKVLVARCVAIVGAAIAVLSSSSVAGAWVAVAPGYQQWLWAEQTSDFAIRNIAVRQDGWLIVAAAPIGTEERSRQPIVLFAVPPWGDKLADGHRLGPEQFRGRTIPMVVVGSSLFVLDQQSASNDATGTMKLVEVDAATGLRQRVLLGQWWELGGLGVDDATGRLLLSDTWCHDHYCTPDELGASAAERPQQRHRLVWLDPTTGQTTIALPDPQDEERSPNQRCRPSDSSDSCEDPIEVAVSPDGRQFAVARTLSSSIDVFDRAGNYLHGYSTRGVPSGLAWGRPAACFSGFIVYAMGYGGEVAAVSADTPLTVARTLATGITTHLAWAARDRLVGIDFGDAAVLACGDAARPSRPPSTPASEGSADVPKSSGGGASGGSTRAGSPIGTGPPSGVQSSTAQAAQGASQSAPGAQLGAAQASQSAAPQVMVADSPQDTPQLGFSSRSVVRSRTPAWLPSSAAALFLVLAAIYELREVRWHRQLTPVHGGREADGSRDD